MGTRSVKRATIYGLSAFVAVVAIGLGNGKLGHVKAEEPVEASTPAAPRVGFTYPTTQTITDWDEYTGRFEAVQSVEIRARVSGYLTEIRSGARRRRSGAGERPGGAGKCRE